MTSRRTRKEKMAAWQRKLKLETQPSKQPTIKFQVSESHKSPEIRTDFYQPEIALPLRIIQLDLTKTLVVTILALFLQLGLFMYLQHGGWTVILAKLQQVSL